ncbi:coilin [Antennarius striatus]|uniref:coilin n=1 Tax=Antennarius striatus TaxID=241820 RepID=UPI0035B35A68
MAAHRNSFIRLRLHFDYPPPAAGDCRLCWLLLDVNACRVVADLESVIRDRFDISRRGVISLFMEDHYLLHTESIHLVRDNDSLRVKVQYLPRVVGTSCENHRKRSKEPEDVCKNEVGVEWKKKRKKESEASLERSDKPTSGDQRSKKTPGKTAEKKKKRKKDATATKPVPSPPNSPVRVEQPVKGKRKPPMVQNVSSDSSTSSSEENEAPRKTAAKKPAAKSPSSIPTSSRAHPTTTSNHIQPHTPALSSSSETSSDEATKKHPSQSRVVRTTTPNGNTSRTNTPSALQPPHCDQKQAASTAAPPRGQPVNSLSSSSEEEIRLVIRQPGHQPGRGGGSPASWRGRGQLTNGSCGRGERGRCQRRGGVTTPGGNSDVSCNGAKEPSSTVLQTGAETARRDYSSMPLLAAPPQVGQRIAFKLLELTENYSPEVSDFKEGKIVSFDPSTSQIELEMETVPLAPAEPGKFDLVYQNPDGSERVEYAVTRGSLVTERWDALLEPRLIL